ncbi:aldo/keto reductase [Planctomycetes bacterium K23_9]|uniref:General stress protein 69 n=1 Tax=Stieleria marina TaxID=1930275 RepID=A0A517NZP2_9BACT|nr:General stress protein 69 [Planctomycetes bacterium K23_9]
MTSHLRTLGQTDIQITSVAMGCWPIAGMTSVDVNDADSLKTLCAAVESGINFFDTAYGYGNDGESERLIASALGSQRESIVIATKGGMHWESGQRAFDASPERLISQCHESLLRLGTDYVDLYYLHAPDENTPLSESAGAIKSLLDAGKTRSVGVSNLTVQQMEEFHAVCPISAVQPHYNMLQREIEHDILPWCDEHGASAITYWPLMKGLLAGKMSREHVFKPGDGRAKYPMFQGDEWSRNQDFIDDLGKVAVGMGATVAQLVVAWTVAQPGITSALCGAKRAYQIQETAEAMELSLDDATLKQVDACLQRRGVAVSRPAV